MNKGKSAETSFDPMTLEAFLRKSLNQQPFLASWHSEKNETVWPGAKRNDYFGTSTMTQSYAVVLGKLKISKILPAITIISKKCDCVSITVSKRAFEKTLNLCKYLLIASVILFKGDSPWKLDHLK